MSNYGLLTAKDIETIEKTLDLVCEQFPEGVINTTELGVRNGSTSRGIHNYISAKSRLNFHIGIDNNHDMPVTQPFSGCHVIIGNSIEVYNQLQNNSQHFIFIDACHSYPMTLVDFLLYSDKVRHGGFVAMHDCGQQIKPMTDYQGSGDKNDPDNYISCRKAVSKLGLLDNKFEGWDLIFDEYDESFHTGGIVVVKKIGK
jgi:hypothetical protein